MPKLAQFVFPRAQRSVYLLEGLRKALLDLERPDLICMLDLVLEGATQAKSASQVELERARRLAQTQAICDLHALAMEVKPGSQRLVRRMARHIAAS